MGAREREACAPRQYGDDAAATIPAVAAGRLRQEDGAMNRLPQGSMGMSLPLIASALALLCVLAVACVPVALAEPVVGGVDSADSGRDARAG